MIAKKQSGRKFSAGSPTGEHPYLGELEAPKDTWTQWSTYDAKVAYFQGAHLSRNVMQKRLWQDRHRNSQDFEGFSG